MAVVEEDSDNKTHHFHQVSTSTSIPMNNNYPRDLFNKFMSSENQRRRRNLPLPTVKPIQQPFHVEEIDEEELELSLGLSMNGRFGVDPNAKKIKRTSSIPEFMIPVSEEEKGYVIPAVVNGGGLIRTCSLPVENEEEWRKRKELQSIRRMEARRKRNEKQRNLRGMRERININVGVGVGVGFEGGVVIEGGGVNSNNNLVEQGDDGLRRTTSLLRSRVGRIDLNCEKESPPQQGGSGGSVGSYHGTGSSSGTSESEGQQHGQDEQKSPIAAGARVTKNLGPQNKTKDNVKNLLEDMPSVSTKGEGPNGKRIEGFLYKYGKGEEVRILCICHGSFLTPAEFVKHAGGPDVTNPLKHIVVSSNLN